VHRRDRTSPALALTSVSGIPTAPNSRYGVGTFSSAQWFAASRNDGSRAYRRSCGEPKATPHRAARLPAPRRALVRGSRPCPRTSTGAQHRPVRAHGLRRECLHLHVVLCGSAPSDGRWVLAAQFSVVIIEWPSGGPGQFPFQAKLVMVGKGLGGGTHTGEPMSPLWDIELLMPPRRRRRAHRHRLVPLRAVRQYPTVVGMPKRATPP